MGDEDLVTDGGIRVDAAALAWRFSRSPGPGGQHVNTTESRVELRCDLTAAGLPDPLRERLVARLGTDELRITVATHRSQRRNREVALHRLAEQLDAAAKPVKRRRATRPSRGAVEERIDEKRRTGERKADRRWRPDE